MIEFLAQNGDWLEMPNNTHLGIHFEAFAADELL